MRGRLNEMRIIRAHRGLAAAARRGLSRTPAIKLRVDTTDVAVYSHVMLAQEYDFNYPVEPRVIIDAGAHIGLSTVWFARRFPGAKIVAVELEPSNFALLKANTRRLLNVEVVHAALWPTAGAVAVARRDVDTWSYQAAVGNDVAAVTVTDLMDRFALDRIDLLKLDVEGSERDILATSRGWIGHVDVIVAELHDRFLDGCTQAFEQATIDFPFSAQRGENVLRSRLPLPS